MQNRKRTPLEIIKSLKQTDDLQKMRKQTTEMFISYLLFNDNLTLEEKTDYQRTYNALDYFLEEIETLKTS